MTADAPRPSPRGSKEGPVTQTSTLLTLAGEKLPIAVDPNAHVCLRGFENAVLVRGGVVDSCKWSTCQKR